MVFHREVEKLLISHNSCIFVRFIFRGRLRNLRSRRTWADNGLFVSLASQFVILHTTAVKNKIRKEKSGWLVFVDYPCYLLVGCMYCTCILCGRGGALVESMLFNRRVAGSNPALAAM